MLSSAQRGILKLNVGPTGTGTGEKGNRVRTKPALLSQTCALPSTFFLFANTVQNYSIRITTTFVLI